MSWRTLTVTVQNFFTQDSIAAHDRKPAMLACAKLLASSPIKIAMTESALETLHWARKNHLPPMPDSGKTLFLRARFSAELQHNFDLVCVQHFKPWADALQANGFPVQPQLPTETPVSTSVFSTNEFQRILLLPARQRLENRALLAQAAQRLAPGGILITAQQNTEGAKSLQSDCEALLGQVRFESKAKCRVIWAGADRLNVALAQAWTNLDVIQPIGAGEFLSRPGVFAWDRIDVGSSLLAEYLPNDLTGRGADLGCGYGFLGARALLSNPAIAQLESFEADYRALELAKANLARFGARASAFHWHDVSQGLGQSDFDFILSNPPFHVGRADAPDLGLSFIASASAALRAGGRFLMVANQHLSYETTLKQKFSAVRTLVQDRGFKVLEAIR